MDAQRWISPVEAPVVSRRIDIINFIEDLSVGHQSAEPMGKTDGHEQLIAILRAQIDGQMLPKGRRGSAQIDDDIQNFSAQHSHELCLRKWWNLEMKPRTVPAAIEKD